MNEQIFKISGFHCQACARLATMKIKKINEVHEVTITPEGVAKVCAGRTITLEEVSKALDGLGYEVTVA